VKNAVHKTLIISRFL